MIRALWSKLKEAATSVLPVVLIVLALNFTPLVSFSLTETLIFSGCALALILGMALFNLGADIAMTPMGEQVGAGLPKSGKFKTLLLVAFLMGVFVTVAEPDLSVLATQVKGVINGTVLTLTIGIGVGAFLVLGVLRVVFRLSLSHLMTFFYLLLFALAALILENGGARGGTVFNGRGTAGKEAEKFFGISVQPEKEIVMILTTTACKDDILSNLYKEVGLDSAGQGIAFSMPVDGVVGLFEQQPQKEEK